MGKKGDRIFERFIEMLWSAELLSAIKERAIQSASNRQSETGNYGYLELIEIASDVLQVPLSELSHALGKFAFAEFAADYRDVFNKEIAPHEKLYQCGSLFNDALYEIIGQQAGLQMSFQDAHGKQLEILASIDPRWYSLLDGLLHGFEHLLRVPMVMVGTEVQRQGGMYRQVLIRFGVYLQE